jgi:anti-sigma B factor antagonist
MLELLSSPVGDWMVIGLRGEVDLASAPQFRRSLHDLVDQGHTRLAMDLSDLQFMDSTGLGVLIGCLKRLREHDGTLVLTGMRPPVARVFEVTGLDRIFTIRSTLAEVGAAEA